MQEGLRTTIFLFWAAAVSLVIADEPRRNNGYDTPQEVFEAYKKARNNRDWNTLFSLGTVARQDEELLSIALLAAYPKHQTLRTMLKKRGIDWEQVNHEWADSENRDTRAFPAIAARLGKGVVKRAELYAEAQDLLRKTGYPSASTTVVEMRTFVQNDSTASGESLGRYRVMDDHLDSQGQVVRRVPRIVWTKHRLFFRRIEGKWYLATKDEIAKSQGRTR